MEYVIAVNFRVFDGTTWFLYKATYDIPETERATETWVKDRILSDFPMWANHNIYIDKITGVWRAPQGG